MVRPTRPRNKMQTVWLLHLPYCRQASIGNPSLCSLCSTGGSLGVTISKTGNRRMRPVLLFDDSKDSKGRAACGPSGVRALVAFKKEMVSGGRVGRKGTSLLECLF